ncbi:MAG: LysR family transcriptional regulator [Oscillospiraceae bacterium]|nr:LysR family transcriptional regulator [Oscillospiraceae bacterium]
MNERVLACFGAAVRTGSFSVAASELYLSQQNVSYNIRKLEEELGFPLFVRRAQRVEATTWGRDFYGWYEKLDKALADVSGKSHDMPVSGQVSDTQCRCFLVTAEREELAAAAEELFYTPQNLTVILGQLERALGCRLFQRVQGRMLLTEAGQRYFAVFSEARESLHEVRSRAREQYQRTERLVRVGVSEWLDRERLLGQAVERLPDITVQMQTMSNQELMSGLSDGRLDLILWSQNQTPVNQDLDTTPVAREELCVYVPGDGRPCPALICPAWPRSYIENRVLAAQETGFGDFVPTYTQIVSDLDEMRKMLCSGGYAAVGDQRFGCFAETPGLTARPLEIESYIMACRKPNACALAADRLTETLRRIYLEGSGM